VEAALQQYRNAPDGETRQRAADALEKAIKKLRRYAGPDPFATPVGRQ
jgi:hypothetical protein